MFTFWRNYRTRQLTVYLRSVDPTCYLRSVKIGMLLLPEGNRFDKIVVAFIMQQCFCNDLRLIN